jgi:hypothetical protein
MALGEMLTKLPVDAVAQFACRCVSVLVSLVNEDREWGVIDAACAALALVVLRYPATVALGAHDTADAEISRGSLPSASAIAQKMFEILPLNVGHAASVLVVLMRLDAAGVVQEVENYLSSNVHAYTRQNFSLALSGTSRLEIEYVTHTRCISHVASAR